jgi:urease accessory protein UreF
MTADVYAGDVAAPIGARDAQPAGAATFNLLADADADLIVRVGAALNLLNVAPREFHMESLPEGMASVRALVDCAEVQADRVARKLQQITSVRNVVVAYATTRSPG